MPCDIKLDDISLHILDIVQNSIRAKADFIEISLKISAADNMLEVIIKDNGSGFDVSKYKESLKNTDNKTGGIGLLIFKESAEKTGGSFSLKSALEKGTQVSAKYVLNSSLRLPVGDIAATLEALLLCCPEIDYAFQYQTDEKSFIFDTKSVKNILEDIPIDNPQVIRFIKDYLKENIDNLTI